MTTLRLDITKAIDPAALTRALRDAGVPVLGLGAEGTTLVLTREGDFTPAAVKTIRQVIDAHDAEALAQAQQAREALKTTELAKRPTTLSVIERLQRIELILGLD